MNKLILLALPLALMACGGPKSLNAQETLIAEAGARDYADRSQANFVACSGIDSNKDGYVTCTIKPRVDSTKPQEPEQEIVCAYATRGCKSK